MAPKKKKPDAKAVQAGTLIAKLTPRTKGANGRVFVYKDGQCTMCPSTWGLTKHHLFGNNQNFMIQLCLNCHREIHQEIEAGEIGRFGRRTIAILAELFPVTGELPQWKQEEEKP